MEIDLLSPLGPSVLQCHLNESLKCTIPFWQRLASCCQSGLSVPLAAASLQFRPVLQVAKIEAAVSSNVQLLSVPRVLQHSLAAKYCSLAAK